MKEVISMWKNTRMIILVAFCGNLCGILDRFQRRHSIVPLTEVRPANVFLMCSAAVWTCGRMVRHR
jgi:hypothetical protein